MVNRAVVDNTYWLSVYRADRHASILFITASMDYAEENRAQFNCTHW